MTFRIGRRNLFAFVALAASVYWVQQHRALHTLQPSTMANIGPSSVAYTLESVLGKGGYGLVFHARDLNSARTVAIKKSRVSQRVRRPHLQHEARILQLLQGHLSIPIVHGYGHLPHFEYLAMELLGKDLKSICKTVADQGKRLAPKTVANVIEQLLLALQHVNGHGIVHRDVKPDNVLCSLDDPSRILLIDFGISRPIISGLPKCYDPIKERKSIVGTLNWASINAHDGYDLAPRDDLESLAYTALFLRLGTLPWITTASNSTPRAHMQYIREAKISFSKNDDFGNDPPEREYLDLLQYARNLSFNETPDYHTLVATFKLLANRLGHIHGEPLDWAPSGENAVSPATSNLSEALAEDEDDDDGEEGEEGEQYSDSYEALDIADYDLQHARDQDLTLPAEQETFADQNMPQIVQITDPYLGLTWTLNED